MCPVVGPGLVCYAAGITADVARRRRRPLAPALPRATPPRDGARQAVGLGGAETAWSSASPPAPPPRAARPTPGGGTRGDFTALVTELPTKPGAPGKTPIGSWPDEWERYAVSTCGSWAAVPAPQDGDDDGLGDLMYVSGGVLGQVLGVPSEGGSYGRLVAEGHVVAWGLGGVSTLKEHPRDGRIYVVRNLEGDIIAIEPDEPRDYQFSPAVVQGLNRPTCVRFSPDGETAYVCASGDGVIWRVTNFA